MLLFKQKFYKREIKFSLLFFKKLYYLVVFVDNFKS